MAASSDAYYIPHGSKWPIMGSIGLFFLLGGFANYLLGYGIGSLMMIVGAAVVVGMMIGWFGQVIGESETGTYNDQVDV